MVFGVQKEQFFLMLRDELIHHGIAPTAAARYVRAIEHTLSEEDTREIEELQDPGEVAELARGIALIKQRTAADAQSPSPAPPKPSEPETPAPPPDDEDGDMKVYSGANKNLSVHPAPAPAAEEDFEEIIGDDDYLPPEKPVTQRGKRIFWTVFLCTIPLTAVLLLIYFAVFGAAFAALCSLIILLVAGLIGGVAVGTALSLTGIVYGITQLISAVSSAPGLYEIGLGILIAGSVMLGGILIYNLAIRLIPLLIRCLAGLFRFCTGELRNIFRRAKEACYKL